MKYLKSISYTIIPLFIFYLSTIVVHAASLSVTINSSSNKIVVGNTVTYTVKVSSSELLGSLHYTFNYDTSKLTLISGTLNGAPVFSGKEKSVTYTFKFRAKASGTANVSFTLHEAIDWNDRSFSFNKTTSKSTTIITQAQLEASYSKNNYLSSLGVNNHSLSPAFNKNTLVYNLEVENDVTSITVSGNKEDSYASVSGLGNYDLNEGINKIEVKVTAQNGSTRIYTINATRKELSPIVVELNGVTYNVARKANMITLPNTNYEATTIKINNEDVPAFINNVTNTTLVGLKDPEGNVALYIYNNDTYTLYNEYSFSNIILTEAVTTSVPNDYKEVELLINNKTIKAYQKENDANFYLIYATNISNGVTSFYQYDSKENTVQLFNSNPYDEIEQLNEKNQNYVYVIIGLGSLLAITYLIILIKMIKNGSSNEKVPRKTKNKKVEVDEEELDKFENFDDYEEEVENTKKEAEDKKTEEKADNDEENSNIVEENEQNIENSDRIEEIISHKKEKKKFKKKKK